MPLPVLLRRKRSVHTAKRHRGRVFADLYEGNPSYDARQYALGGRPFLVHKATEGIHHIDARHALRCENTHAQGLAVGHYHFLDAGVSPVLQAHHFWNVVRGHFMVHWPRGHGHDAMPTSHTDFLILDVEVGGAAMRAMTATFDKTLFHLSQHRCIGYASKSFLIEHGLQVMSRKWWVADYPTFPGRLGGGRILWAHQFTDAYRLPGIGQPCDASVLVDRNSVRYWGSQPF